VLRHDFSIWFVSRTNIVGITNYVNYADAMAPAAKRDHDFDDDYAITDALVQLSYAVQQILAEVGAPEGLSVTQIRLLGVLRDRQLKVLEIAAHLGLEKSSASGLIDRAERRGLLERRTSDEDGRAVLVTLSPAGQKLAARGRREVRNRLDALMHALPPSQAATLGTLLDRLLTSQQ
jgi:MarR family transcriptional regulator, lower aerobic nicotinate degradation pathway regulator